MLNKQWDKICRCIYRVVIASAQEAQQYHPIAGHLSADIVFDISNVVCCDGALVFFDVPPENKYD
jgi:hypothetical protein